MEIQISNQFLCATISSLAAEVISLKKGEEEFVWDRNKEDWHNCNPILFPIVGPLKDNSYTYKNQTYSLNQHGFLRRSQFNFIEIKKDSTKLQFKQNQASKELYPFDFTLTVSYRLDNDKLLIAYHLENNDDKELPFDIGFHPAFVCCNYYDENFAKVKIRFEKKEDNLPLTIDLKELVNLEKQETFFYQNFNSEYVELLTEKHTIRVAIKDFTTLGFWRKSEKSEFICIEPQHPVNNLNKNNFFSRDNKLNNLLAPKCSFDCQYYWQII
ncbi:MAG: hypothetical protein ACI4WG_02000 [Erysipelotrichaceae bacterium]